MHNQIRRPKNLVGRKFNYLTVVEFSYYQANHKSVWKVVCECGNTKQVLGQLLINGHTKSCGCLQKGRKSIENPDFMKIKREKHKWGAKYRDLDFQISKEDMLTLFEKQNGKCALSGVELIINARGKTVTASLDRIDSKKGYVRDNVQWIHKDLQRVKMDMPQDVFLKWVEKIYTFKYN